MNTYKIIDNQTDEIIAENQNTDDLIKFANDLFWNDDIDFVNKELDYVIETIETCDYRVIKY